MMRGSNEIFFCLSFLVRIALPMTCMTVLVTDRPSQSGDPLCAPQTLEHYEIAGLNVER